jgi:hypothetical protein
LAELGFFCKELNVGWAEWVEAKLPAHEGRVERGSVKCTCSRT